MRSARKSAGTADGIGPSPKITVENVRMALEAAGMVTWEWDARAGTVRYSDNMPTFVHGEAIGPYCTIDALLRTIHPEDRDGLTKALNRTLETGRPFECEYRVRLLDGDYHWILGKGNSVIVEGGRPVRVLGVSYDITARKHTEQELRKRSRQLAELASALTMAEQRERRHLADLLHEHVQQLLVAARMQAHSLAAGERGPRRRQIDALHRALDEALDLTRSITTNLAPPALLHNDPAAAFKWLAKNMRAQFGLSVAVQTCRDFAPAPEAFLVLLFTAAKELLLNVVKHARTRTARLLVRREAGHLTLEVRDRGGGFDPATPAPPGDHVSFGLFSIRERAQLLGGSLSVESIPRRGTRVVLSLPLPGRKSAPALSRTQRLARPDRPSRRRGKAIRIVLADDHCTVREGLMRLLKEHGDFKVVGEADNGEQAIDCVGRLHPDVVVMDVKMPVMDGIEATRIIAKRWPRVRVIGLSMFDGDSPFAERMHAAGASGFVSKTAPPEELLRAIRSRAAEHKTKTASRRHPRPRERTMP